MDEQIAKQIDAACAVCGKTNKTVFFEATDYITRDAFSLLRCHECGTVETAPRPVNEELPRFYPTEYFGSEEQRFTGLGQRLFKQGRLALADQIHRHHGKPGRALDIGCGPGWILERLQTRGWECHGTEMSQELVQRLSATGLQVYREPDLRNCHFPDQHFDVVTLWHVFEHISNPSEILDEIHRITKPGSLIIIATPDIDGAVARFTRENWFALDVPRHLFHYSHKTLPAFITKARFNVIRKHNLSLEQDIFGMAQSLMNKLGFHYNQFYMAIRHQSAQVSRVKRETLLSKLFFAVSAVVLTAISIPAALVFSLLKSGGTIEVWALR